MKTQIIPHKEGNFIVTSEGEAINYVRPIDYFEKQSKFVYRQMELIRLQQKPELRGNPFFEMILRKNAHEDWVNNLVEMRATKLPYDLLQILTVNKKKEQVSLLKGKQFTSSQFSSFLLRAGEGYGYRYSRFRVEFLPSWAYDYKLPKVFHLRGDGEMDIVGDTNMTEGQLKQLLQQRTVRISHFLDNGFRWHCFFTTYRSLRGEENYGKGTPHLHYLSNFWELKRSMVISGLKSRSHKFTTSVHIPFHRHA